ncbi:MAG: hypothetical protein WC384_04745 [Prolixibacteraceae bacterium]
MKSKQLLKIQAQITKKHYDSLTFPNVSGLLPGLFPVSGTILLI